MPLLRTVKPIKTLKDKDSGKNSTESVHNQEESSSCMSILFENEIVDFTTTKKTKRNRVCGGLCSYSPSGDQNVHAFGLRIYPLNFVFTLGISEAKTERIPLPIHQFQPSTRRT